MEKIFITGASGFIGSCFLKKIINDKKYQPYIFTRSQNYLSHNISSNNFLSNQIIVDDIYSDKFNFPSAENSTLIHFAWQDLSNFRSLSHLHFGKENFNFLKKAIESGIRRLIVAGTCLEYGLTEGELLETRKCKPIVPYAEAKYALYKKLKKLSLKHDFKIQWVRIFYAYGKGQSSNSLLPSIDRAYKNGELTFNMSEGSQLRDFISVDEISNNFIIILKSNLDNLIINCSSGSPISVYDFALNYIKSKNYNLEIKRGKINIPFYEPKNFWGNNTLMRSLRVNDA